MGQCLVTKLKSTVSDPDNKLVKLGEMDIVLVGRTLHSIGLQQGDKITAIEGRFTIGSYDAPGQEELTTYTFPTTDYYYIWPSTDKVTIRISNKYNLTRIQGNVELKTSDVIYSNINFIDVTGKVEGNFSDIIKGSSTIGFFGIISDYIHGDLSEVGSIVFADSIQRFELGYENSFAENNITGTLSSLPHTLERCNISLMGNITGSLTDLGWYRGGSLKLSATKVRATDAEITAFLNAVWDSGNGKTSGNMRLIVKKDDETMFNNLIVFTSSGWTIQQ